MRFARTDEQDAFAEALARLLGSAGVATAARRWAEGSRDDGLALWQRLAEAGVAALRVPEDQGGMGGSALDVAVAFEELGRHAVPGPWISSAVLAPELLAAVGDPEGLLGELAGGKARASLAAPPLAPWAVDAEAATHVFLLDDTGLAAARAGAAHRSVDTTRHLHALVAEGPAMPVDATVRARGLDLAALACAADLLGAGERMLAEAVEYAGSRRQFGRPIGEYQALKHLLADVRVELDFARPLVHGAAVALDGEAEPGPRAPVERSVSAAKVAASDAAYRSARAALQVHGAIGYTTELDLSLWITRVRALVGAWGTPGFHRGRVLASLTRTDPS